MTIIAIVLVGVILLIGAALLLAFNFDGLPEDSVDHGDLGLPDRLLTADDVPTLRFRTGVRGYRMEDVDAALALLEQSLREAQRPNNR